MMKEVRILILHRVKQERIHPSLSHGVKRFDSAITLLNRQFMKILNTSFGLDVKAITRTFRK
jgi:hypothetical protein